MLNITNEIASVNKNLTVGEGKSKYKAVGEADVLKAVKELEFKHKVYSYPVNREIIESTMYTTSNQYGEKNNIFSRIKTTYRFVNVENPDEYIEIISYAEGIDTQDKGAGKAMTYSDKYALMKAYKIITGEDPDQNPSQEEKVTNKTYTKQKQEKIQDELVSDVQAKGIYKALIKKLQTNEEVVKFLMDNYSIENTSKLMKSQYAEIVRKFK
jgi:hypothetical protein